MRLRRFFIRAEWDCERRDEIESYIQIETDDNIVRGMSPGGTRCRASKIRQPNVDPWGDLSHEQLPTD